MLRFLFGLVFVSFLGCSVWYGYQKYITLDVSELNNDASKYDGEIVFVTGKVQKSISILGFGGYILSDGKESILVASSKGVPKNNSIVSVKGKFRKAVSINGFEYNVLTQESNDGNLMD